MASSASSAQGGTKLLKKNKKQTFGTEKKKKIENFCPLIIKTIIRRGSSYFQPNI